ncbi:MAG TPA: TetR/AcrR family transcriptional regulator [Streptosporangiaceae bacterium]|jgi:AcrR family transcriptional regulator
MRTTEPGTAAPAKPGRARSRRRGPVLEDALLRAAWQELAQAGYAGLAMEKVAERAGTSKAVVYRRWPTRAELILAAIRHHVVPVSSQLPDTGNLRGDVLAVLGQVRDHFHQIGPAVVHGLMAEYRDLPEGFGAVMPDVMTALLDRAEQRGEIRLVKAPARVLALPGDLLRHELLVAQRPGSDEFLAEVVDDIFLPLVSGRC